MAQPGQWTVRLTHLAEADFQGILAWTARQFSEAQARIYAGILSDAVCALENGPEIPTARPREDIGRGIRALHVARDGRRGRHFLLYRISPEDDNVIEILRILHGAMDLPNQPIA
jgi:toxin ParE1/3/4